MTVVPPNLEKGTENVIRERTGSATGIVAEKRRGIETGIRIVKEVTETEIVIATTGIVASAAREGNTVIVLTIVTVTVTMMIATVTGAMILTGTGLYEQLTFAYFSFALMIYFLLVLN
jgi:hypothetical protein